VRPLEEEPPAPTVEGATDGAQAPLTVEGAILGTPAYMSPEQRRGEPADARSDQFSFCVALYEALYGVLPLDAAGARGGAIRPASPSSPVPARIERALWRGLADDPAARFPSMEELLAALSFDPESDPASAPQARRLLLGGLAVSLAALALAYAVLDWRHAMGAVEVLHAGLSMLGLLAGFALVLRRRLARNAFHWGLMRTLLVTVGQMVAVRWMAVRVGLDVPRTCTFDLLAVAAGAAMVAWRYLPGAWAITALCVATSAALTIDPGLTRWVMPTVYPFVVALFLVLWHRASRADATRAPRPGEVSAGSAGSRRSSGRPGSGGG
jgi:hypothetical protein